MLLLIGQVDEETDEEQSDYVTGRWSPEEEAHFKEVPTYRSPFCNDQPNRRAIRAPQQYETTRLMYYRTVTVLGR